MAHRAFLAGALPSQSPIEAKDGAMITDDKLYVRFPTGIFRFHGPLASPYRDRSSI